MLFFSPATRLQSWRKYEKKFKSQLWLWKLLVPIASFDIVCLQNGYWKQHRNTMVLSPPVCCLEVQYYLRCISHFHPHGWNMIPWKHRSHKCAIYTNLKKMHTAILWDIKIICTNPEARYQVIVFVFKLFLGLAASNFSDLIATVIDFWWDWRLPCQWTSAWWECYCTTPTWNPLMEKAWGTKQIRAGTTYFCVSLHKALLWGACMPHRWLQHVPTRRWG